MSLLTKWQAKVPVIEEAKEWSDRILQYREPHAKLEYIRSTGPQYLDTGVLPTNNYKIEIKFRCESFGSASYEGGIWGGETGYNSQAFHLYRTENQFDIGFSGQALVSSFNANAIYEITVSNGSIIINGTSYSGSSGNINASYSVYLFALHRASTFVESTCSKSIYYCKIYNGTTLVRDFIPAKDEEEIVCMYDRVNSQYYYNIGSGSFVGGPEI